MKFFQSIYIFIVGILFSRNSYCTLSISVNKYICMYIHGHRIDRKRGDLPCRYDWILYITFSQIHIYTYILAQIKLTGSMGMYQELLDLWMNVYIYICLDIYIYIFIYIYIYKYIYMFIACVRLTGNMGNSLTRNSCTYEWMCAAHEA